MSELMNMSDADFELELGRVQEEYNRAYRRAKGAFRTLEMMQRAWDQCNKWHSRLNGLQVEDERRTKLRMRDEPRERFVNEEIGA